MQKVQIPTPEYISKLKSYEREYFQAKARFKVLEWHRGSKKTSAFLNDALIKAPNNKGLYWFIGAYLNQTLDTIWKDPSTHIFRWIPEPYQSLIKVNNSDHSITFPNGSVFQVKGADKPDSLRGPKPVGVYVDEYGEIAKRHGSLLREQILEPSIRISGGYIHYAGTPKGQTDLELIRAKSDSDWWSSVKTVEDTSIFTPEEIENIRANATNLDFFYQEYYCRVLEGASSVFKGVNDCIEGGLTNPEPGRKYIFGIDLARTLDRTAIVGFDSHTNHLVYFKLLENTPWTQQHMVIRDALLRYNNAEAVADATGGYDSFVSQLQEGGLSVQALKISSNQIKRELVEKLGMYIQNRYLTFPHIQELLDELNGYEYKVTRSNNITYSAPTGKHDDVVMALSLAVHRLEAFPQPFKQRTVVDDFRENMRLDPRTGYPLP